jgi:hypothetical protein
MAADDRARMDACAHGFGRAFTERTQRHREHRDTETQRHREENQKVKNQFMSCDIELRFPGRAA